MPSEPEFPAWWPLTFKDGKADAGSFAFVRCYETDAVEPKFVVFDRPYLQGGSYVSCTGYLELLCVLQEIAQRPSYLEG